MMTLPAEIIEHIFSFLHSDPETLRACSRSHSFLSSLVEPHLYSRILLKRNDLSCVRTFSPWDFAMLLSERPYIANYIRDLEIHGYGSRGHVTILLEKVSNILPMLLSLRRITVNHAALRLFSWRAQPKCFRLAFWACLRLPSMKEVCLENVTDFPPTSFLDNRYSSLNGLTLRSCSWMGFGSLEDDVDPPSSSHSNGRLPFEYLCFELGDLDAFTDWSTTGVQLRLHSLEYSSKNYKPLTKFLTSSSTTLVNLYLDIGLSGTYLYNSRIDPPTIQKPQIDMPDVLSMVPCLEELTIRSPLNFYNCSRRGYGFHCAIPVIAEIFSNKFPSVLERLTLSFDCHKSCLPEFCPPLTVSNVICIPLTELLSGVSAFSPSIQVNIVVNENSLMSFKPSTELPPLLSLLRDSEEIMGYFKH